ncbi:MAG: hypothetical protein KatS3mg081_2091 [Gemmatimonadales bacterium]|nr:MAG: hypothetical protein KatS3mg081_2091 [Gemmatimonadales bacterium]
MAPEFGGDRTIRSQLALGRIIAPLLLGAWLSGCARAASPLSTEEPCGALEPVPARGTAASLDVATWNLYWFGSIQNGPGDESCQLKNVRDIIIGLDFDLWSVQEVVDPAHFAALVSGLAGYGGLLATDPAVTDGARYYSDFEGQEQKVGLIYKSSVATVRSARVILGAHEREFGGRPPVEVELTVTVDGTPLELTFILIHAKAGSGQPDWEQRNAAAALLKDYLDRTHPAAQVMVVGDFNDDVDVSITPPNPSPYMRFVDDSTAYFIPTKALSEARKRSTVDFTEMIDHHLVTDELKGAYLPGSAEVFPADQYLASYRRTTSDHYPVLVRYLPR